MCTTHFSEIPLRDSILHPAKQIGLATAGTVSTPERCFWDCCPAWTYCTIASVMRVTVIGTGYVGLVTGACLSYLGHRVTCVDSDAGKVTALTAGQVPIFEPNLEELLA